MKQLSGRQSVARKSWDTQRSACAGRDKGGRGGRWQEPIAPQKRVLRSARQRAQARAVCREARGSGAPREMAATKCACGIRALIALSGGVTGEAAARSAVRQRSAAERSSAGAGNLSRLAYGRRSANSERTDLLSWQEFIGAVASF